MRIPASVRVSAILALAILFISCAWTDIGLTTKVKAKLAADEAVRAYEIDVKTQDGVTTLTGYVGSEEAKNHALELAKNTEGVVRVVDMIAVKTSQESAEAPKPDLTLGQHLDDATITMRVKSRLLESPTVEGLKIDVDTRDAVVFLTGRVRTEAEKEQAIRIAKEVEGVRDVRASLTIQTT